MLNAQFDIKKINVLKDILIHLRHGATPASIKSAIDQYFGKENMLDLLFIELELLNGDYGITIADVEKLSSIYPHLYGDLTTYIDHAGHPVQIFKRENTAFQMLLNQINQQLESFAKDPQVERLTDDILRLGQFHSHYHRKEKLVFPMMERYGYFDQTRKLWRVDDRIRALYVAVKKLVVQQNINITHLKKTFVAFEKEFRGMIFQEEAILFPILQAIFSEADWQDIGNESGAFGYALIEPEQGSIEGRVTSQAENGIDPTENIRFGGGYLTTEEANLILNNIPLEITFVDKNSVFKYFNEITEAAEMMLIRTPISIGRNVANCHPPKSLKKVMTLVRDLKTKKRTSESMWYKRDGKYIHLTYKALFNEQDEFLGILEYVQDIQPFFELPNEVKTGLSKLEE